MAKPLGIREHTPELITGFNGLFKRGVVDSVPRDSFIDALNVDYGDLEVKTRDGFTRVLTRTNIRRAFVYKKLGEISRYLILNTSGELYDSLYGSALVTNVNFDDFSMVNINDHAYITFHDRVTGITGSYVYLYDGAGPGTLRFAAGSAPTGFTLVASEGAASGNIETGTHLIAVAYKTDSGFITSPGPANFVREDSTGGHTIDISSLPLGPAGTVSRMILATRAIADYNGDQFGYEFFFAHELADNTSTTYSGLSFFDADLFSSADYLFDNRSLIPAGLFLIDYNGRMAVGGVPGLEHYLLVSKSGEPEVFDEINGLILIDPSDAVSGIVNAVEHRKSLHIYNSEKCYVTNDNGNDPNTWAVEPIDKSVGTTVFGISRILDSKGTNSDRYFVASKAGLCVFESGIFRKVEATFPIMDLWAEINGGQTSKIQVEHDSINYLIYISVPLEVDEVSEECSHLLVGDYSNAIRNGALIQEKIKWSKWNFPWHISSIFIDYDSTQLAQLFVAGFAGNIYIKDQTAGFLDDEQYAITSYFRLGFLYQQAGWVHHFGAIQLRAIGVGALSLYQYGLDDSQTQDLSFITLTLTPGQPYFVDASFEDFCMSLKCSSGAVAGDYFKITFVQIDVKPIAAELPR